MSATHSKAGRGFFGGIGTMFSILGAARNAAAAAEAGRRPAMADLKILGIDPKAFDGVRF